MYEYTKYNIGKDMRRIRLIVAYDGTKYCGWQRQANAETIEGVLNKAISELCGEEIEVIGASRTDSGVHSYGNVAVFDTNMKMAAEKFRFALNTRLPDDVRVQYSDEVSLSWHPRKRECTKTYMYRILNRNTNIPTERLYAHFCYYELDIEKMREACSYFIGTHDFTSMCSVKTTALSAVRTIYSLEVIENGDIIEIVVSGNGFLYNMVRIITGTLLKVGMGQIEPEDIYDIINAKDRNFAGQTMPPQGLFLLGIEYEE